MVGGHSTERLRARMEEIDFWYHSIELRPGLVTPGEFDLRGSIGRLPWPRVQGRRCLDVGTYDGFYAFELERRGAAEITAVDLDDAVDLDWLPRRVPAGLSRGQQVIGRGFWLAHEARGSSVQRVSCSVYDLDPTGLGRFDVVTCGALLQHLRDPAGALLAMRRVCEGELLSVELVDEVSSLALRRRPTQILRGDNYTWSVGNVAAHHHLLSMAGWDVVEHRLVGMRRGAAGRAIDARRPRSWRRTIRQQLGRRLLARTTDPVFSAVRAVPATALHEPLA